MPILFASLLWKDLLPIPLRVIQDEGNKLHQRPLRLRSSGIRLAGHMRRSRPAGTNQGEEVLFEDQAKNKQHHGAAEPNVHSAELKSASARTVVVPAIFNILAFSTGCPFHGSLLGLLDKMVAPFNWPERAKASALNSSSSSA